MNGGGRKSDLLLLPLLSVDDLFSCMGPFLVDEMEVRNLVFVIRRLGGEDLSKQGHVKKDAFMTSARC